MSLFGENTGNEFIAPKDVLYWDHLATAAMVVSLNLFFLKSERTKPIAYVISVIYKGTPAGILSNPRASETIKTKAHWPQGNETFLEQRGRLLVSWDWWLWWYFSGLRFYPCVQHLTVQTQTLHNSAAKPYAALRKLSIPSQFHGDLWVSQHHCTFKILGISYLILFTQIL